jgi:hypothetical protein
MASAACPHCKHTTTFDPGTHEVTKIIPVTDRDGKTWVVYLVTCERCRREFRAGGKDGRGNV